MAETDQQAETNAKAGRRKRLVKRTLGGLALGLVLVPTAIVGFLHTDAGGEFLRKKVVQRLGERTTGTPSIEKLSFSLSSGITLDGVVLRQANGQEAVRVNHLLVHPALLESVRGRPTLTDLEVKGVRVNATKKDDGSTTLADLFKPTPPSKPADPSAKPKEPAAYVRLARIAVSDVDVGIKNPDGSTTSISHVHVAGDVTARPRTKGVALTISDLGADVHLQRADGTRIAIEQLKTSASATLTEGAGPFRLGDISGVVALTPAGKPEVRTPLAFGAIEGTLSPGQLSLAARTISALFLSIGSVKIEGRTQDGAIAGPQAVAISGLTVEPDVLAKVTGRKVLAQPLVVDVAADGSPEALHLVGGLASAGQKLAFDGVLDARVREKLGYDVTITSKDFAVAPLLATEAPPDVKVGALSLKAKGTGTKAETVAVDITLGVQSLVVKDKPIDAIDLSARLEAGRVTIKALDVKALGQAIHAEGSYVLADKAISLDVKTSGNVQASLQAARKLGIAIKSSPVIDSVQLTQGAAVKVRGHVGGALDVTIPNVPLQVLGARALVDAVVHLEPTPPGSEKKLEATSFEATVKIAGLSPRTVAKARGKNVDVQGALDGIVHVHGSPKAPLVDAQLRGRLGAIGSDDVNVALQANVAGGVATAKGEITPAGAKSGPPLLTLDAHVPLPGRAPAGSKVRVSLDVPRRDFDTLLPVLPAETRLKLKGVRDGFVSAHVDIDGTAKAPAGTVDLRVSGKVLSDEVREVHLTTKLTPGASGDLAIDLGLAATGGNEGPSANVHSDVRFERSPLVDPKAPVTHHTTLAVDQDLAKLPTALPLPPGLGGLLHVEADLQGTREDLLGKVLVSAKGIRKEGSPAVDLSVEASLRDAETVLAGGVLVAGERLLDLSGTIALPGKGALPALKTEEPRALALKVKVPDRTLASLGKLAPKVEGLPGDIGGTIDVTGTTAAPQADGALFYRGYPTAVGKEGNVLVELSAKAERAEVRIVPGDLGKITVGLPLGDFLAARKGEVPVSVPATVTTALSGDLAAALPRLADPKAVRIAGKIESDLGAELTLGVQKKGVAVRGVKTAGKLGVSGGRVELPRLARTFHDIGLSLAASEQGLALDGLSVHEKDVEKADRAIEGKAIIPLETQGGSVALGQITADLVARDFLLSGGNFGEHDAPRAALSGAVGVKADLSGDTRRIEVDAHDLVLFSPDRQPRAHAQEVLSKGDVVDAKKVPVGSAASDPVPAKEPTPPAKEGDKALEVRVHVARTRVYQAPIDLHVEGDVLVERAPGRERTLGGGLKVTGGRMLFGGKWLDVDRGELKMTPEGPVIDVFFKREAPVWALRDVATEGAGHDTFVRVHLVGVVGQQQPVPIGLGDSLFEALAVLNLGQVRTITRPDLPASATPQLPQVREIRQTSFMAANLPHLAFMDHAGVTSSSTDGRNSYGRLSRVDAQRYFDHGGRRIRVTTRPLAPGQSEGEVAHEWLFQNDKQVVSGAGVQAGTRLGGGPTVFWEWSSKE